MMKQAFLFLVFVVVVSSCGPGSEATKPPVATVETKEMVFRRGHQFFLEQQYDSAAVLLGRASAMDGGYVAPLVDLGEMYYLIGMRDGGDKQPKFVEAFGKSLRYLARAEALGSKESLVLERLCELANIMEDDSAFIRYASKNAKLFPYDRQYFNLGFACFKIGDYQGAISTQKEAVQKFEHSPYIGSFYRQLGRAYMKVDRDQTAERTFVAGVQKVDSAIANLKKSGEYKSSEAYHRLLDDKIGMLTSLRSLHQTYRAMDKLERVEHQLKEANEERR